MPVVTKHQVLMIDVTSGLEKSVAEDGNILLQPVFTRYLLGERFVSYNSSYKRCAGARPSSPFGFLTLPFSEIEKQGHGLNLSDFNKGSLVKVFFLFDARSVYQEDILWEQPLFKRFLTFYHQNPEFSKQTAMLFLENSHRFDARFNDYQCKLFLSPAAHILCLDLLDNGNSQNKFSQALSTLPAHSLGKILSQANFRPGVKEKTAQLWNLSVRSTRRAPQCMETSLLFSFFFLMCAYGVYQYQSGALSTKGEWFLGSVGMGCLVVAIYRLIANMTQLAESGQKVAGATESAITKVGKQTVQLLTSAEKMLQTVEGNTNKLSDTANLTLSNFGRKLTGLVQQANVQMQSTGKLTTELGDAIKNTLREGQRCHGLLCNDIGMAAKTGFLRPKADVMVRENTVNTNVDVPIKVCVIQ